MILKAYSNCNNFRLAILSIILVFTLSNCSLTRRLKPDQALVRKITIKGMDKEFAELAVNYVDKEQQPNNVINLEFYYLFSKNGKKDIGEAPAILDSSLVEFSRMQIEKYIQNKGYLKAKVSDSIVVKKKKAELIFTTVQGPMFRVRGFKDSIADKRVESLYQSNKAVFANVSKGSRFDTDSLSADRDGFYQLMKRNGYFDFYRQYVTFIVDSTFDKGVVDVKFVVDNPDGKSAHPIYKINNTLITISKSNGKTTGKADTIQLDSQFRYVDFSGKFKPHTVTDYIFQKKGELYNIDKQNLTTTRLSQLNVFRNVPNPTYTKLADSTNRLDSKIDIIPLKRMSDRIEGEVLFNAGRYGFNVGNTFTDRNIFKQAAILQFKINESILLDNNNNVVNQGSIENQDLNIGLNLIYPRIISPFNFAKPGKYGVPHTTFATNFTLFFQKGLVERESFLSSITYDFFETPDKQHIVTPIAFQYSRGIIDPSAYQDLLRANYYSYIYLIGRTIFTSGSQYSYVLNANKLNTYSNFVYFRGNIDVGGNTLYLLSKIFNTPKDTLGERTIFGYSFSQYSKAEIDLRFYKSFGGEQQLIFRINPGLGVPYGNSNQLIFEKNFYAGGSDDMRAWLPRTLGPGNFNRASYGVGGAADTLRSRLQYLDQFGEVKLITNLEYRYKLSDDFFGCILRGAVFMDAGNVWRLHKQEEDPYNPLNTQIENPNGEFRLNNILQSSAIGIGTGLRFDLGFFVFRFDAAFKFKDPEFNGSDQWVLINHFGELFHTGPFKTAYTQTNGINYNFMQLNFGIGLPF
ncbi:Outer membrane protein assembly factor BamA [Mucilaginibacter mallensis]|uniref:Outer membrane protein assembly factor BamA n=2 Tax=Mucilaginibacter mallensis TaxID=652787 RepID=A0A1H1ZV21_MUCMA|nr:Outer membrane protein assembly factor BamA [Mucilaginibacter mallensis]